jgi:hypothetical protein
MAGTVRISALTPLTSVTPDDFIIINNANSNTQTVSFDNFVKSVGAVMSVNGQGGPAITLTAGDVGAYTIAEVNTLLLSKADAINYYTKTEVDALITGVGPHLELGDFSVVNLDAVAGTGQLSELTYDQVTGVFTYKKPDLSGITTNADAIAVIEAKPAVIDGLSATAIADADSAILTAATSYTDTEVSSEATRATTAEGALSGRITTLEANAAITDPITATQSADADGVILNEAKDFASSAVSAEETRALTAEAGLSGRLDTLEADPTTQAAVTAVADDLDDLELIVTNNTGRINDDETAIAKLINNDDGTGTPYFASVDQGSDADAAATFKAAINTAGATFASSLKDDAAVVAFLDAIAAAAAA